MNMIGSLRHLSKSQPIKCVVSLGPCTRSLNKERCLTSLRIRRKQKLRPTPVATVKETLSSTSSLSECPSDNTAEDKSVQNPNEIETLAASDQPSTSGKKITEKRSFSKRHCLRVRYRTPRLRGYVSGTGPLDTDSRGPVPDPEPRL